MNHSIIEDLVTGSHILANEGVLDGFGHVSIRAPDDPSTYFVSRARAPELVERDETTGKTYLKIPVESTAVVQDAVKLLGSLLGKLGG